MTPPRASEMGAILGGSVTTPANLFNYSSDDLPNRDRIVMVGIGQGVSVPFKFIRPFHSSTISSEGQHEHA